MFENWPYADLHDLNLDWIIQTLKEILDKFDAAISSRIKMADPPQWDITKAYSPLTIVIDNNAAYISSQPVPPGIQITDTDYWQPVFDMSVLYNDINQLRIDLEAAILAVANDLSDLNKITVKTNAAKHLLVLGDSYTVWYSNALYNDLVSKIGIPADQCHNVAVSGASFYDNTNSFLMQAQGYTGDKDEITDILIMGGINDALLAFDNYTYSYPDVSSVTNAMDAFKIYCNNNYPNAKIHIAYIGGCLPSSTYYSTMHPEKSQEWARWCYTLYAAGLGFNVLSTWNAIHTSKVNYNSDGLHPSQAYGVPNIASAVVDAFNGKAVINSRPQVVTPLLATGKNSRDIAVFCWIDNDTAFTSIPDNYIQIRNGETIGNDQYYPIFTLDSNTTFQIRTPHYYNIQVAIAGFAGMSTPIIVPAVLLVQDGVVSIKVFYLSGGSYQTLTASNFSTITFYSIPDFAIPLAEVN